MNDSIERLRSFVVEREKIACGSDIVTACNNSALRLSDLRALLAALEAAREDAARYRWLRTKLTAANFHPEDPNGLDLGEGVALIFMLPPGSHVTPDLNWTIDQARGKEVQDEA